MQFSRRLQVLEKSFHRIDVANKEYLKLLAEIESTKKKLTLISNLSGNLKVLNDTIVTSERQWRETILSLIEYEIQKYLSIVYPSDAYSVNISCDIKYGKIKILSDVSSSNFENSGIRTQGRLFKQIVSVAAVAAIMKLKGIHTIYLDEAFSGAAKKNMHQVSKLIQELLNDGLSLVLIVQNEDLVPGKVDWHSIFLDRTIDNCTVIKEENISGGA